MRSFAAGARGKMPRVTVIAASLEEARMMARIQPDEVALPMPDGDCGPVAISADGSKLVTCAPAVDPAKAALVARYGTSEPTEIIDQAVDAKAGQIVTRGTSKALTYRAKDEEVRAYRATTPLALTSLTTALMLAQFPTLMAMVAVWSPNATTVADQRTALAAMVAKVEGGIQRSAQRLRKADAIGTKAKEDLRAAAPAARPAILATAIAAIDAV